MENLSFTSLAVLPRQSDFRQGDENRKKDRRYNLLRFVIREDCNKTPLHRKIISEAFNGLLQLRNLGCSRNKRDELRDS